MVAKKNKKAARAWVQVDGGHEKNSSPEIIQMILAKLKFKRVFVVLLQKGYHSGNTIIVDYDDKYLFIDRPRDWPGSSPSVRVIFRDDAKVWNYFTVKVLSASQDTLKTLFPTELFRLQRRSNFRIKLPWGSEASFCWNKVTYSALSLVDISVGGALLSADRRESIVGSHSDETISNIVLEPTPDPGGHIDGDEGVVINIMQGRIVREVFDRQNNCIMIGVLFLLKLNEEKELMKFVRQRELGLLRKGIKE